jgi:hypothetical protein
MKSEVHLPPKQHDVINHLLQQTKKKKTENKNN